MTTLTLPRTEKLWNLTHAILLIVLMYFISAMRPFQAWPVFWFAGLGAYFAVILAIPPLRATFQPWKIGRLTPYTITATVVISAVASATLLWFQWYSAPPITSLLHLVPEQVLGSIVLAGIVFSVLNAVMEEITFRGILQDSVTAAVGPWVAIFSIGVIFGLGHIEGYPPGMLGALLSGIYSLMLGWLRHISGGLLLPILSHVVADATIFQIVRGW